jgi:hypothetical protein
MTTRRKKTIGRVFQGLISGSATGSWKDMKGPLISAVIGYVGESFLFFPSFFGLEGENEKKKT